MSNIQVVIMAAGMGSRFGGLKQIDGMGPSDEFLMDYAIYDAYKAGVREICLVVRESFRPEIEKLMADRWAQRKDLKFKFICQELTDLPQGFDKVEREKPWGTAHVLYVLRKYLNAPFAIMNADDFYGRDAIQSMVSFLSKSENQHALVSYPLKETLSPNGPVTRGVCVIEGNQLKSIDEVPKIFPDDKREAFVSMNLWGFSPSIFPAIEEYFKKFLDKNIQDPKAEYQIPQVINDLLKTNQIRVEAIPTSSPWFGVTYKEDKESVQNKIKSLVNKGIYPESLFKA